MSGDRTLAPSPTRWRRAWRAGLRPSATWLWPAAGFGALALALDGLRDALGDGLADASADAGVGSPGIDVRPGAVTPDAWLELAVGWLAAGLWVAGALAVAVALLSRRLGLVSPLERRRLGAAEDRPGVLVRLVLVAVVITGLALGLQGVLAGAARAVDASEAGLAALWLGWAARAAGALGLGLGLGAGVELWLDRRERRQRLRQSPQQLLDELREGARAWGGPPR